MCVLVKGWGCEQREYFLRDCRSNTTVVDLSTKTMDVDALISAVFKRSPIWDKRDKLYANRTVTDKLWKQIATEINNDETLVRKKWKYLRDNFAVEFSKRTVPRSGDAADSCPSSKWQYFSQLMFLKDIVTPRSSSGSLKLLAMLPGPSRSDTPFELECTEGELETTPNCAIPSLPSSEDPEIPSDTELQLQREREDENVPIPPKRAPATPASHATPATKRKRGSDDYYNKILEIEAQKVEYLHSKSKKVESENTDLMYYKSLLPHVREIPKHLKLEYQTRVETLVQEFAYGAIRNQANHSEPLQAVTNSRRDSMYESYCTSSPPRSSFTPYSGQSNWSQ